MSLEVLEVLDKLETPRREAELLNFLYYSNYSIDKLLVLKIMSMFVIVISNNIIIYVTIQSL